MQRKMVKVNVDCLLRDGMECSVVSRRFTLHNATLCAPPPVEIRGFIRAEPYSASNGSGRIVFSRASIRSVELIDSDDGRRPQFGMSATIYVK